MRRAYAELAAQQEAEAQAERDRVRLEREGPVRAVAEQLRDFPGYLQDVVDVLAKPRGAAKLAELLRPFLAERAAARRAEAEAARIEADKAQIEIDAARRLAAHEQGEAKRKARAATAQSEGRIEAAA